MTETKSFKTEFLLFVLKNFAGIHARLINMDLRISALLYQIAAETVFLNLEKNVMT
jgi:hypothetical protein